MLEFLLSVVMFLKELRGKISLYTYLHLSLTHIYHFECFSFIPEYLHFYLGSLSVRLKNFLYHSFLVVQIC